MATVKIKFGPSSIDGGQGSILCHVTRQRFPFKHVYTGVDYTVAIDKADSMILRSL